MPLPIAPLVIFAALTGWTQEGGRLGILRSNAREAEESGRIERAVWLWRQAEDEARLAKDKAAVQEIRARLEKHSPKEAKSRKLLTGSARSLRKCGINYLRKKQYADAFELLCLAESIESSIDGDKAIVRCLFDSEKDKYDLPFAKIMKKALASHDYKRKADEVFRLEANVLIAPASKSAGTGAVAQETDLATMPGLRVDCEFRMPEKDAKAGLYLGMMDDMPPYSLVEIRRLGEGRGTSFDVHKFILARNSYNLRGGSLVEVDAEDWIPIRIEVRSGETSVSVGTSPLHVVPIGGSTMDGELCFQHEIRKIGARPNSFRNLRIRPLLDKKSALAVVPEKLHGLELETLFDAVTTVTEFKLPWLAQAYLQRIGALAPLAGSKDEAIKAQVSQLKKVDRLYGSTLSACKRVSTRLGTVARGEDKEGRAVLAAWYRSLAHAALVAAGAAPAGTEDEAQLGKLRTAFGRRVEKAETRGKPGAWKYENEILRSPGPRTDASSLLLLPPIACATSRVGFTLPAGSSEIDVVLSHPSKDDAFFLRFIRSRGKVEVKLIQTKPSGPGIVDTWIYHGIEGKGDEDERVEIALHSHHVVLTLGSFAPRIIPLDPRRLSGRIGFHLPAQAARRPVLLKKVTIQ